MANIKISELNLGSSVTNADIFPLVQSGVTVKVSADTLKTYMASMDDPCVISVNSSSDALRITQTGAGNALLVEDSANPDATPFVIDSTGVVVSGNTTAFQQGSTKPSIQIQGTDNSSSGFGIARFSNDSDRTRIVLAKSRGGLGSQGIVQSGDVISNINSFGSDGTGWVQATAISSEVDGTPGTNDMPGRLVFSTTADGASGPTERMRIDNAGRVGIGGTPTAGSTLHLAKAITGATTSYGLLNNNVIQSDVTADAQYYNAVGNTAATAFTLPALRGYYYRQATFGAGSSVTNQYGFFAESDVTGATNNYGFYSNIASGTGRWNFYAAGSATNYFAGAISCGSYVSAAGVINGASLTAVPAGGNTNVGYTCTTTSNFGVFFGSGAPTLSAAKGSLYLRSDGSTTNNRMYVNTDGATTWTAVTTAA